MKAIISSNTLTLSLYNVSFELMYLFRRIVRYVIKLKLHLNIWDQDRPLFLTINLFLFQFGVIQEAVKLQHGS